MKKSTSLLLFLLIYIFSFSIGLIFYFIWVDDLGIILSILISDIISTIIIWIIGVFVGSASIYDPYWSVQTPIYLLFLMIQLKQFNLGSILLLSFVLLWAIRLTINFIIGFNDFSYIDWRYKQIQEKTGKIYQLVNLIGIHLMPTLIVFFASTPAFMYVIDGYSFSGLNIIGLTIMLSATIIEFIADKEMKSFIKIRTSRSEINRIGIWKNTRHPNYLGEILFWYGIALIYLLPSFNNWYLIFGAITNNLMFMFISIPLADNHLKTYKANYPEYKKETWSLLILPKKK